jgi:hypothetical protein
LRVICRIAVVISLQNESVRAEWETLFPNGDMSRQSEASQTRQALARDNSPGSKSMTAPDTFRSQRIPLTHGSGAIPALGFGTLIHDRLVTGQATKTALEVGFRHLDCAERYRNEDVVGEAMQAVFRAGAIGREDIFVATKLWNTNHRPERVTPAFEASCRRLRVD